MRILVSLFSFGFLGLGFWLLHASEAETASSAESATVTAAVAASMVVPRYDGAGSMLRPEGYRTWVFVGASLGLRYPDEGEPAKAEGPGTFHNVYVQPEAFEHYVETGEFPEKTILAMETYETGTREPKSELTGGFFEAEWTGLSAAVKDKERFPEGWGYVTFRRDGGPMKDAAEPFARERCYDCHVKHGATDNVFTQFYPVLRDAR